MWKSITTLMIIYFVQNLDCQLIRPNHVYEQVITGVHHYYNNTCIILLHATKDPINTQGLLIKTKNKVKYHLIDPGGLFNINVLIFLLSRT